MSPDELAKILRRMYDAAPHRRKAVMPSLFGIRYAQEIGQCGETPDKLVELSGIPRSYGIEVRKGKKLREWVMPIEPYG